MFSYELADTEAYAANLMAALVCERYGPPEVLRFVQRPQPTPKADEVLIRVLASTITAADRRMRSMDVPGGFGTLGRLAMGWRGPRNAVLGSEFAGVVQTVGDSAKGFLPGDAVFGFTGVHMGAHAEYLCMDSNGAMALKPERLSFASAAALSFGGTTALSFFRRARLQPGESVLVNGASGNVGAAATQLACVRGAMVTGVCSTAHLELVRSLGASCVINYQREDFTTLGQRYDVVFDVACHQSVEQCLKVLKPGGRLIRLQAGLPDVCRAFLQPQRGGRHLIVGSAEERADDLKHLAELVRQGRFRPVIACLFPFEELIQAHRYADRPSRGGSVVIKM